MPGSGDAQIVGFSYHEVLPNECANGDDCQPSKVPLKWPPIPQPDAPMVELAGDGGYEARGTNNAGNIVGLGYDATALPCRIQARFWQDATAEPFDLHAGVNPPIDPTFQTRAHAINNRMPKQVVGANLTEGYALLWEQDGSGNWMAPLNLDGAVKVPSGEQWDVIDAHDINDEGCIAAWGIRTVINPPNPPVVTTNVVLLYENCPADCGGDDDAEVGIVDLLALLAQWGTVDSCDITGGGVGINDLLDLLAAWGPCCRLGTSSPPQSVQDCIDRFGYEPIALEHCICAVDPSECPE